MGQRGQFTYHFTFFRLSLGKGGRASLQLRWRCCPGYGALPSRNQGFGGVSRGKTRVFWAGIGRKGRITGIAHPFGQRITKGRFCPGKKTYTPHVTLGRFRKPPQRCPLAVRDKAAGEVSYGNFTAGDIALIQSILTPQGPIYKVIQPFDLGR